MKRIFAAAALALATGCRGPSQVYDPFLGRTTVDPPGTASPPPGQPYYGAPPVTAPIAPPAAAAPMPRYGSPNFAPTPAGGAGLSSSFTPNVSPNSAGFAPTGKSRHVADYAGFQFRPPRLSAARRHGSPSAIFPWQRFADVGPGRFRCHWAEQSSVGVGCRPNPRGTRHHRRDRLINRWHGRYQQHRFELNRSIK